MTMYWWVQRFTPLVIDAARPCRHACANRWLADETSVKAAGRWRYVPRTIGQSRQVIDVLMPEKQDLASTRRFFSRALRQRTHPTEVTTDRAQAYRRVLDELLPAACHVREKYANKPIKAHHGRVTSRLRPMRGLTQLRCARVISAGHASSRSSAAATANSGLRNPRHCGWRLPSPSWPWPSDQTTGTGSSLPPLRITQQCPPVYLRQGRLQTWEKLRRSYDG